MVKTLKGTKADFEKKKVKVGRKVKRANVTKITVKTKQIQMPVQTFSQTQKLQTDSSGYVSFTRSEINYLSRQLHHYSEPARIAALHRVKDILQAQLQALNNSGRNATTANDAVAIEESAAADVSAVALLLPEVVELIFSEEREVRVAVKEAMCEGFLQRYSRASGAADVFVAVMPVIVTYLCSGLSNLDKVIPLTTATDTATATAAVVYVVTIL